MTKLRISHKIFLTVVLAAIFALGGLAFAFPARTASAASEVKTSALWKTSDGVKNEGTAEGSKLSLTSSKETGSVTFKNPLYMKNTAIDPQAYAEDFRLVFTVTSNEFKKLTVGIITENPNPTITDKLEHKIDVVNKGGKIALNFKDGSAEEYEVKNESELALFGDHAFNGSELTVTYLDAEKKLTVACGGEKRDFILQEPVPGKGVIKDDAAELKFTFSGITQVETDETAKVASFVVKEINGQSLSAPDNAAIEDNIDPILIVDDEKYENIDRDVTDGKTFYYVRTNSDNDLPVRVFDVVQTSLKSKTDMYFSKTSAFADDAEPVKTYEETTHFTTVERKAGYYKLVYSVPVAKDAEERVEREFYYRAADANQESQTPDKPVIDLSGYETDHAQYFKRNQSPAGKQFRVPAPAIRDDGFNNEHNVVWKLWYRTPTSSDWTSADGLAFTPSSVGTYRIRFQARDSAGNWSEATSIDDAIAVTFIDLDKPTLNISGFPSKGYAEDEVSLPSGSASDSVDSSPTKTLELYFYIGDAEYADLDQLAEMFDENAEEVDESVWKKVELKNNRFTPTKEEIGDYVAVYTARDSANHVTVVKKGLAVVEDTRPAPSPTFDFWTPWTITFVCIGSASLLGILVLLFIKPKKETRK